MARPDRDDDKTSLLLQADRRVGQPQQQGSRWEFEFTVHSKFSSFIRQFERYTHSARTYRHSVIYTFVSDTPRNIFPDNTGYLQQQFSKLSCGVYLPFRTSYEKVWRTIWEKKSDMKRETVVAEVRIDIISVVTIHELRRGKNLLGQRSKTSFSKSLSPF